MRQTDFQHSVHFKNFLILFSILLQSNQSNTGLILQIHTNDKLSNPMSQHNINDVTLQCDNPYLYYKNGR